MIPMISWVDPDEMLVVGGAIVTKCAPGRAYSYPFRRIERRWCRAGLPGHAHPSLAASPPHKIADVPQLDRAVQGP